MMPRQSTDRALALVALGLIIVGCFLVLRPFLTAILWAAILTITLFPLYVRLQAWLSPVLASLLAVALIALGMIAPFAIVGFEIADNAERLAAWIRGVIEAGPPAPPDWLAGVPVVGPRLAEYWSGFAHDTAKVVVELKRFVEPARRYLVAGGTTLLGGLLQLSLSVLIAFFLFRDGAAIMRRIETGVERLAPHRGRRLVRAAVDTIRGVVIGILGTAIAQGVLAALGFWIAGIQAAPLLGFATFLLSAVPVGPPIIWGAAGFVLIQQGDLAWGLFVLAWGTLVVSTVDNVIKPLIISKGSDLPFILVLLGVLGGIVAFGFIGVFVGPVLLAIGYALAKEWSESTPASPEDRGTTA
jgi:predicted PurR-regulated permease PerM